MCFRYPMVNTVLLNLCVNWCMTLYETFAVILVHKLSRKILEAFFRRQKTKWFQIPIHSCSYRLLFCCIVSLTLLLVFFSSVNPVLSHHCCYQGPGYTVLWLTWCRGQHPCHRTIEPSWLLRSHPTQTTPWFYEVHILSSWWFSDDQKCCLITRSWHGD